MGFTSDVICRRCGTALCVPQEAAQAVVVPAGSRAIIKRVLKICAVVCGLLLVVYLSLLWTSSPLTFDQEQIVGRAIQTLDDHGFSGDAALIRQLVSFRSTDNWWNHWVGHAQAYAATNFPFEVVTLYPDFFNRTADDVERAVILLHEIYHLRGHGEESAHREVWLHKNRLGWNQEKYGKTRVWKNVREATINLASGLFRCGQDGRSDCTQ